VDRLSLRGGIDRIHPQPGGIAIEKGVQRPGTDGLVYFLEFDAAGRLWAGTERGVDTWDGSHWSHYDTRDGLAWDDCNLNAFAAEADGTVWIGRAVDFLISIRVRSSRPKHARGRFHEDCHGTTDVSGRRNPSFDIHSGSLIAKIRRAECSPRERDCFPLSVGGREFNRGRDGSKRTAICSTSAGSISAADRKPETAMECGVVTVLSFHLKF